MPSGQDGHALDATLSRCASTTGTTIAPENRINHLYQTWNPSIKNKKLSQSNRDLIQVAQNYNVQLESTHPSYQLSAAIPFWGHPHSKDQKSR